MPALPNPDEADRDSAYAMLYYAVFKLNMRLARKERFESMGAPADAVDKEKQLIEKAFARIRDLVPPPPKPDVNP